MPTYLFEHTKSKKKKKLFLSISERDQWLADNPEWVQGVLGAPRIGYRTVTSKPDAAFRDLLKVKRKAHKHSTIDSW